MMKAFRTLQFPAMISLLVCFVYFSEQALGRGRLIEWNAARLKWFTSNGEKPIDHSKDCSILSSFATALNIECEHAISVAFVIGFGSLFCILLLTFIIVKRRYCLHFLFGGGILQYPMTETLLWTFFFSAL